MKILIVTNELPPYLNASSAIIYRIAEVLRKGYGQKIVMLGLQSAAETTEYSDPDFQLIPIRTQYDYSCTVPPDLPKAQKLLCLIAHPKAWPMFLRHRLLYHPMQGLYQKKIRQVMREIPDIDCAIAVNEPIAAPCAMTKIKMGVPWISYRLDPWATHCHKQHDVRAKKEEQAANQACAAVLTQPATYREYLDGRNSIPMEKLHMVEFPNLRPLPEKKEQMPNWTHDRIHCAYIGQFYSDIRNPDFMVNLFAQMHKAGIVLHIIGNGPKDLENWGNTLPDNIILHGRVSYEAAIGYMQAADILVNLGNTVSNQMPSKLIDYFSVGKPILNIYKTKQCPTLSYINKHPAALSIYEGNGMNMQCFQQVLNFCMEQRGRSIPFAEMEKIYPKCTPEYVGKQVYDVICSISH